jgi:AcrR family transcriptional regulator
MAAKRLTAEQRRREILEATARVVARKNYDRATISAIAREARINEALIYRHFQNKQDLELSMLDHILEQVLEIMRAARELQNPSLGAIRSFGRSYHRTILMETDKLRCVIKAITADDEKVRERVWSIIEYFQRFIRDQLTRISERGELDPELDKDMTAWVILATTWMLSILAALDKAKEVPEERVDAIVRYLERRLRPENAPAAPAENC